LDLQLKKHGIHQLIIMGLIANAIATTAEIVDSISSL
jgi:hypothetical protein